MTTVDHVLHKLWSHSKGSELEHYDEKRLWMLLQAFIERKGGLDAPASDYDVRGGAKPLTELAAKQPAPAAPAAPPRQTGRKSVRQRLKTRGCAVARRLLSFLS